MTPLQRLPMIDLMRALAFFAIIIFHASYTLWAPAGYDRVPEPDLWVWPLEAYARALSFSGFTIILLSFFLFGFKNEIGRGWQRLWLILAGFFVVWAVVSGSFPYIWDIYPYLLIVLALAGWTRRWPGWWLVILGGITVSTPFWNLEPTLKWPDWLSGPLFGNCSVNDSLGDDWPLLPWIGYPIFALGLGRLARDHEPRLRGMKRLEIFFWVVVLALSLTQIGEYYVTPLGNRFACYIFRRPLETFWAHQIWVIFLVRLGFLPAVHTWLSRSTVINWLSRRAVNRRFFLAYFIHYPYCLAWAWAAIALQVNLRGWIFALGVYSCAVWVECSSVVIRRFLTDNK